MTATSTESRSETAITPQTALIYTMVLCSAADRTMTDSELRTIGDVVRTLPIFRGFDVKQLTKVARDCASLLARDDGFDTVIALIRQSLPKRLRETAYAVACDVVASDLHAEQEELRMLAILRERLDIERLSAAAIERGARARFATI
ncbi:MAG: tellurite resistance TerB family protein [Alphaproteobacteria bacterium]|nr:tellurite resistance TerB family protein [Alphaproteobacteria bacterium]MCW5751964.1 tellurite resistance TerB family protein [Alphaproteobacteria bacterium]